MPELGVQGGRGYMPPQILADHLTLSKILLTNLLIAPFPQIFGPCGLFYTLPSVSGLTL